MWMCREIAIARCKEQKRRAFAISSDADTLNESPHYNIVRSAESIEDITIPSVEPEHVGTV